MSRFTPFLCFLVVIVFITPRAAGRHCGQYLMERIQNEIQKNCCPEPEKRREQFSEKLIPECTKQMEELAEMLCGTSFCKNRADLAKLNCSDQDGILDKRIIDTCCPIPSSVVRQLHEEPEKPTPECIKHMEDRIQKVCGTRSCTSQLDFASFCKARILTDASIMDMCCFHLLPEYDYAY